MAEKKPKTGTGWIIGGSLIMAWGLLASLNALATGQGPVVVGGLVILAAGIYWLVTGINKRAVWKKSL
jgi:hypothetical protein